MGLLALLSRLRGQPQQDPQPAPERPLVFGPGAIMDPPAPFPYGPGAVLPREPTARGSVSQLAGASVNGMGMPDAAAPMAPMGHQGFAPPSAPPQMQQQPSLMNALRAGRPAAQQAAMADMETLAAEPWTERPDGFLPGIGWDLREALIRRQMERMRGERK